jgi:SAM-dependent methyltransferase
MKKIKNDIIDSFFSGVEINDKTDLCIILEKYGSDKCSDWHNYSLFYDFIFSQDKGKNLKIFEVGIYGGSSIRSWKEYFKNSHIYCGDINNEYFINEDRIKSYFCDQDNPESIKEMWENLDLKDIYFDIIIDDGKHEYLSNINFLENSYHKLKKGGIFIVEDLTESTFRKFEQNLEEINNRLDPFYSRLIRIENEKNTIDNNILILQK